MAGSSPYGPVVVHQTKDGRAGDSGSVDSMATRSSTNRSRQMSSSSTNSDASSAASTTWSGQHARTPVDNAKSRANSHTGRLVSVYQR